MAWVPPSLPDSIVLLGGIDGAAARFTAEIVPGFEKWSSFTFSLLQVEEPLHCVTVDGGPAGFLTKTRL